MSYLDFNDAEDQKEFGILEEGSILPFRIEIKPGGHNDPDKGWTDGMATLSSMTGSVYLNCEMIVTDGAHEGQKIYHNIGLHSPKGDKWRDMGRSFIKAVLISHYGLDKNKMNEKDKQLLILNSLADLDGKCFVGKIGIDLKEDGREFNTIKKVMPGCFKAFVSYDMDMDRSYIKKTTRGSYKANSKNSSVSDNFPDDEIPF
jgi:hypothetical protein